MPIHTNAASVNLTDKQKKWLSENAWDISFAPEKDFPPMIWTNYSTLFGVSIDYFDRIQQELDVRFKVKEPQQLKDILTGTQLNGEKNIISSVTLTPERSEYLLFTQPYFSSKAIFISNKNNPSDGNAIIEHNLTVAVGKGYGAEEYLRNYYPEMKLVEVDNDFKVITSILNNQTDIGVIDIASLIYLIRENNFQNIRKIGDTGFQYDFAFAVPKDMPELRNILNQAILSIPQGFSKSILEKWKIDTYEIEKISDEKAQTQTNGISNKFIIFTIIGTVILFVIVDYFMHIFLFKREEDLLHKREANIKK